MGALAKRLQILVVLFLGVNSSHSYENKEIKNFIETYLNSGCVHQNPEFNKETLFPLLRQLNYKDRLEYKQKFEFSWQKGQYSTACKDIPTTFFSDLKNLLIYSSSSEKITSTVKFKIYYLEEIQNVNTQSLFLKELKNTPSLIFIYRNSKLVDIFRYSNREGFKKNQQDYIDLNRLISTEISNSRESMKNLHLSSFHKLLEQEDSLTIESFFGTPDQTITETHYDTRVIKPSNFDKDRLGYFLMLDYLDTCEISNTLGRYSNEYLGKPKLQLSSKEKDITSHFARQLNLFHHTYCNIESQKVARIISTQFKEQYLPPSNTLSLGLFLSGFSMGFNYEYRIDKHFSVHSGLGFLAFNLGARYYFTDDNNSSYLNLSYDDNRFGQAAFLSFQFGDVIGVTKQSGIRYQIGLSKTIFDFSIESEKAPSGFVFYGLGWTWQL